MLQRKGSSVEAGDFLPSPRSNHVVAPGALVAALSAAKPAKERPKKTAKVASAATAAPKRATSAKSLPGARPSGSGRPKQTTR